MAVIEAPPKTQKVGENGIDKILSFTSDIINSYVEKIKELTEKTTGLRVASENAKEGDHFENVRNVTLVLERHYFIRRKYTYCDPHFYSEATLCKWTKHGWVDCLPNGGLMPFAGMSILEVWTYYKQEKNDF